MQWQAGVLGRCWVLSLLLYTQGGSAAWNLSNISGTESDPCRPSRYPALCIHGNCSIDIARPPLAAGAEYGFTCTCQEGFRGERCDLCEHGFNYDQGCRAARRHGESPFTLWFTAIFGAVVMLVSIVALASTFFAALFGKNSISTAREGTAIQQTKDGPTIWDGRRQRIIVNGKIINAQNNHVEHDPIAPTEDDTAVIGLDDGVSPTSTPIGDGAPPKSPDNHDHSTLPGCIHEGNQMQP